MSVSTAVQSDNTSNELLSASEWHAAETSQTLQSSACLSAKTVLSVPTWVPSIEQAISGLLNLPPNWDSYGAKQVSNKLLEYTVDLLSVILTNDDPIPQIVPTSRGGVQIEWHTDTCDLEIEIIAPHHIDVYYENTHTGEEWEKLRLVDLSVVRKQLATLRS